MERMKITAGLGSIDDYIPYVKAGADELFAGFVPAAWQKAYGPYAPLNRREVLCSNVQLGSLSELEILAGLKAKYGADTVFTFNSPFYLPEQYPLIVETMSALSEMGFSSFIIADPGLLLYLHGHHLTGGFRLHISGEAGEISSPLMQEYIRLGAERILFHRKVPIGDMARMAKACGGRITFEAFAMNEKCHFHGAWCASLHCDMLPPMCRVPYILSGPGEATDAKPQPGYGDLPGMTGCGLCALHRLRESGVTYLKCVGRGARSEDMLRDIAALRTALDILESTGDESSYIRGMKKTLFPEGCSGNCYYYL